MADKNQQQQQQSPADAREEDSLLDPNNVPWHEEVDREIQQQQQEAAQLAEQAKEKAADDEQLRMFKEHEEKIRKNMAKKKEAEKAKEAKKAADADKAKKAADSEKARKAADQEKARKVLDLDKARKAEEVEKLRKALAEDKIRLEKEAEKLRLANEAKKKKAAEQEQRKRAEAIVEKPAPRKTISFMSSSSESDISDDAYEFMAIVDDCQSYAQQLDQLLETPYVQGENYDRILSEIEAIDSCLQDLEVPPKGLDRKILVASRNCKRDLLVKRARILKKYAPGTLEPTPNPPPSTSFQQEFENMRKKEAEEKLRRETRAKELAKSLVQNREELYKSLNSYRHWEKSLKDVETSINDEFQMNILQFERLYLKETSEASNGHSSHPKDDDYLEQEGADQPAKLRQPQIERSADGSVYLRLPKGKLIPISVLKVTAKGNCIFCDRQHHSFLCCSVNTLEERKQFYQRRNLCVRCSNKHNENEDVCRVLPPQHCRWFECLERGHHPNLCPNAPYPITRGKCDAWQEVLEEYKVYLPEKTGKWI